VLSGAHSTGGDGATNPWWQLDMGSVKQIDSIRIQNRDGSCSSRLFLGSGCSWEHSSSTYNGADEGAVVGVSDFPCTYDSATGSSGCSGGTSICTTIRTPESDDVYDVDCHGASGRYAYIMLPGNNRMLNFMEFDIDEAGAGSSFELIGTDCVTTPTAVTEYNGGTPSLSYTYSGGWSAAHARDNNAGTGAHSTGGSGATNPWWQLDMGSTKQISTIKLQNRDGSCSSRLFLGSGCSWDHSSSTYNGADQGAVVGVSDSPCTSSGCSGGTICTTIRTPESDDVYDIDCNGATGRYAYIMLPGNNRMLNFMEFDVNQIAPPTFATDFTGGTASLSYTYASTWSAAHARDNNAGTGAHSTGGDGATNPWWQLDMGSTKQIDSIQLQNRDGSCSSRLFLGSGCSWDHDTNSYDGADQGAVVGVSDSPCTSSGCSGGTICTTIRVPDITDLYHIDCHGATGQYAYVMLPGNNRMLNFMEFDISTL